MNSTQQDKLQADLKRRSKELDAREEYLDDREHLIRTGPIDLTVLQESIRVKTKQLKQLKSDFASKEQRYQEHQKEFQAKLDENSKAIEEAKHQLEEITEAILDSRTDLKDSIKLKNKLDAEAAERKHYLDEQEQVISSTIDEGNATLRGISFEIQAAKEELDDVKQSVAEAEVKKTDVGYELVQLEDRYQQDKSHYEEELNSLTQKLSDERFKISDAQARASQVDAEIDSKLHKLSIKEQELTAKQDAIRKERTELDEDKRRWHSYKNLYGDTI